MEIRNIESTDIARALQMAGNVRMEYSQEQPAADGRKRPGDDCRLLCGQRITGMGHGR